MRHTKHTATMLIPVLMLLVWACGDSGGEPQSAVQGAGALSAQPLASASISTTVAEPEPDNTPAAMARPPVTYLEEPISPCTPIDPNREDPCEAEPPPGTRSSGLSMSPLLPDPLPAISEVVIHELTPSSVPHMVVRATGIPDTARCDGLYPVQRADFRPKDASLQRVFHYICFMDFRINEYIIGEGPPELTMDMGGGSVSLLNREDRNTVDEQWMKETFDLPEPEFYSRLYDGKEFIIMVGIPINFAVETWTPQGYEYSMWQIIREDDELRAISRSIDLAGTPEQRQALNRPLNEVIQEIKEAVETRTTVNEGRIGLDPNLPMIITDANELQDFYIGVGAVYEGDEATVLPPPVPGAEDLEQDPTRTGENQPQPSTPPAPGEETPSPPPTDDAVTTTTQPVAEETPTTTTQPQAEDTIPTPTETTQPSDDDSPPTTVTETTRSQTGGTIPAPTETTQAPGGGVEIPAGTGEQTAQPE